MWTQSDTMEKIYRNFHLINVLSYLLLGWLVIWFILSKYTLQETFILPVFPVFFWAWGWVNNYIIKKNYHNEPKRIASIYMLLKLIKNVLSGTIILVIFINFKADRTKLLMTFGAFYLINLALETLYLTMVEKNKKKEAGLK